MRVPHPCKRNKNRNYPVHPDLKNYESRQNHYRFQTQDQVLLSLIVS
jgi:hypothetical protein